MCLHQRGSKNGHCPCCKADASFSPSSHFPPPAPPRQQAACPCRSGPVHNPVRSQPGHICGAHGAAAAWERGNLAGGEGRSARPLAVQQCVAVQVQHRHNQQHWRISCSQMRKKKKKSNFWSLKPQEDWSLIVSLPAFPRELLLPSRQPCRAPVLAVGAVEELPEERQLVHTPGDALPPSPSRNPTDRQRIGCSQGCSSCECFQPQNACGAFREWEEGGGLPAALRWGRLRFPPALLQSGRLLMHFVGL